MTQHNNNQKHVTEKKISRTKWLLAGIALGFLLHHFLVFLHENKPAHFEIRSSGYQYINPLLDCELTENAPENKEISSFEEKVEDFIRASIKKEMVYSAAVYFRDLNNGPWFSIRPNDTFSPSSLLKVPLMMAIYKKSEANPDLLKRTLYYSGEIDHTVIQNFKPEKTLVPGENYSIDELIYRMIVYSDNNASALLEDFFGSSVLNYVYQVAGVENVDPLRTQEEMSVETYARFFRILFNASFLNRELSEKALGHIAEVHIKDGMNISVPSDIKVAHKFGEEIDALNGLKQLHECGIVYYPGHPYLLCVMTKGRSFDELDRTIMEISHIVYESVDRQQHPFP